MARSPGNPLPPAGDRWTALLARYLGDKDRVDRVLQSVDDRRGYLPWRKFRHLSLLEDWEAEDLWHLLRFHRQTGSRPVAALRQKDGRPFTLYRTDPMLAALHRIDKQQELWNALAEVSLEDRTTYRLMAEIEEAHHSSAIEGAVTTRRQSRELIRSGREPRSRSERMVLNTYLAMGRMDGWIESELTPGLIQEFQEAVTEGTLDDPADVGRIRTEDDVYVFDESAGEIAHVPPPAGELGHRLEALCAFANEERDDGIFMHPLTRAILLHHQLAYDHPFVDGNGRTARTLFMWSALRSGYRWFRSLSISRAIHAARSSYYRSFLDVQVDGGDVTYFVRDQLLALESEIERLAGFLRERARLAQWFEKRRLVTRGLNTRQLALVEHALEHEGAVYEALEHAGVHGVTQPTAWKDLTQLVREGLLDESKSGRKKIYRPSAKLRALADEAPGTRRRRP